MTYAFQIDAAQNSVFVRLCGPITLEGMLDLHRALLSDPLWFGGCRMVYDLAEVTGHEMPYEDLMALAREYSRTPPERVAGPIALVAPDDAVFGLLRMLRGQLAAIPRTIQIFRDIDAAREWLDLPAATETAGRGD
jgi:hypothetical protein